MRERVERGGDLQRDGRWFWCGPGDAVTFDIIPVDLFGNVKPHASRMAVFGLLENASIHN